ncbi:MAG: phosphoesterase [Gammaproteobacteria bacterium]|jgi:hypothetical protein|nr:phosphoesterase [Gammaproteobacteria bacterium]
MLLNRSALAIACFSGLFSSSIFAAEEAYQWIAGDHHIHSRYSTGWDREQEPPAPILGGDAIYPIHMNALMAKYFGLGWMVATDHGGPNHSKVNLERAYPELQQSRLVVPEVLQFWGMEFDTPGADHSSLIIPHSHEESQQLFDIESRFAKREPWPADPSWDTEPRMLEALGYMATQERAPVLIANHPSRSASDIGVYGLDTPSELRDWNDTAPNIAVGMAAAPGHQAAALNTDGSVGSNRPRGYYSNAKTMGGFDQYTAIVGGFWDSMLGEGRRWWVTANSDSHVHYSEGGVDFWPGEYSKTHVWAQRSHDSILEGIRNGRVFVTTGDLISALDFSVTVAGESASLGETIKVAAGSELAVTIRFLDPESNNARGENPGVTRVDLIQGELTGAVADRGEDANPTAKVQQRFSAAEWSKTGAYTEVETRVTVERSGYLRLRGTNGYESEPTQDEIGEDPWSDLWFYSNPIFFEVE